MTEPKQDNQKDADTVSFDEAPLYARVISYGVNVVVGQGLWVGINHWLPGNVWKYLFVMPGLMILMPVTTFIENLMLALYFRFYLRGRQQAGTETQAEPPS